MASMVSSQMPAMTVQEKGSRNKRKFRAEPPLADPNKAIPLPFTECTSFEFSAEKFDNNHGHNTNGCDFCCGNQDTPDPLKLDLGLSCPVGPTRTREEIDTSSDDFHDADWSDLTESQLEELVLSNLDTIFKSAIKKIVASGYSEGIATKAILRSGLWYGCKDTVSNIVDNTLAFLRSGQEIDRSREHYFDDLQQMEKYILAELVCLLREVRPFFSTGDAMWCLLICDMNVSHACAMDSDLNSSVSENKIPENSKIPVSHKPNAPNITNCPNPKPKTSFTVKERQNPISEITEKPFTATDEKKCFVGGSSRKVSGITKREYILRQKSIHFEKHYRKGTSRAFGSLLLDKKLKGVENSKNALFKNPTFADTELSLSFPAKKTVANPTPISYNTESADISKWAPQERKDEMIVRLVPRVRELRSQLQEWNEWANQKVMQAARRLGKDKAELKTLRQEKDEVDRLKKEKQSLEESTVKKLHEMENALRKASGQVERANGAVRRLEFENGALRREMEAARLRAEETAASCREVARREKKALAKFRVWERQKAVFHEEVEAEKLRMAEMERKLGRARDVRDQAEARLNQEEKAKDELLTQIGSLRKERDQIEASTRSKEHTVKSKAETNLHKYKADIERLEKEISQLRLKTDSSKIAALKRGIDGSFATKLNDLRNTPSLKDSLKYFSGNGGVKRERECVMCLSEEMSVVFLPCAHQVVCTMCNELHEKQGMKECPSCRGPIQRRVCVRYARSS